VYKEVIKETKGKEIQQMKESPGAWEGPHGGGINRKGKTGALRRPSEEPPLGFTGREEQAGEEGEGALIN